MLRTARFASIIVLVTLFACEDNEKKPTVPVLIETPGSDLSLTLTDARVGDDRRLEVTFWFMNGDGTPRSLEGVEKRFTLASFSREGEAGAGVFNSVIVNEVSGALGTTQQPAAESNGELSDLGGGQFRYRYATALPEGYDRGATYRAAAWVQGTDENGAPLIANGVLDFVPGGGTPAATDAVVNESCNTCHAPLEAHGGSRRDVRLCVTCHTPQLFDPDTEDTRLPEQMNPLDMAVMVHRIHTGRNLPTLLAAQEAGQAGVKYHVIGFRGSDHVYGETVADGPDADTLPDLEGVVFPRDTRDCQSCHTGNAPLPDTWKTGPSAITCGGCHDATWLGPADAVPALHHPHAGGPVGEQSTCGACHLPSGQELDASVTGAHTLPGASSAINGLQFEIVSVEGAAGANPTVVFRVKNGDGSAITSLEGLDTVAATVSGPTTEYLLKNVVRQDIKAGSTAGADGTFTYQFTNRAAGDAFYPGGPVIPADATGTFSIALEGRRTVTLTDSSTFVEGGNNPVSSFSVDGSPVAERRKVVELQRCDICHREIRAHGSLRREPAYCVMCHTADATDWGQRPKGSGGNVDLAATADNIEERSIRLSVMTHRIHTGEELEVTTPFIIYGFRGSLHRYDEVLFPGNLSRCASCHLPETFTLDAIPPQSGPTIANETSTILHAGSAAHAATGEAGTPIGQSICLSCHDTPAAHAHVELQTTAAGVETCAICHGEQRDVPVSRSHAGD